MRIKIVQNVKEFFEADFSIYDGVNQIGTVRVVSSLFSFFPKIEINIYGEEIKLYHSFSLFRRRHINDLTIQINELESGNVFETNDSLFSNYYYKACISLKEYFAYRQTFGNENPIYKIPIYCSGKQVGLLLKPTKVYNLLHNFELVVDSKDNIIPALIMGFYFYGIVLYERGQKVISSKRELEIVKPENGLIKQYAKEIEHIPGQKINAKIQIGFKTSFVEMTEEEIAKKEQLNKCYEEFERLYG